MKFKKYVNSAKISKDEAKKNISNQIKSKDKPSKNNLNNNNLKNISDKICISKEATMEKNAFNKFFQDPQKENVFGVKEIIFNLLNSEKIYNIEQLRHLIIKEQKQVNYEYNLTKKKVSNSKTNKFEKLISLIARYCIIIYYLIQKNHLNEAKNLLLLMIKENINHIDSHTFRLFKIYTKLQQKYEIINVYPKAIKELFKIYSILIKYCSFFNLSAYKNMFLVRYLSLHSLNYKVFKRKFEIRGFNVQTRNELKYLFSICLHYASFLAVKYFCPLKISISILGLILKVYRNLDDYISTKQEKSLIINTLYNQSIFYFLNDQADSALRNLRLTKQKIISFYNKENMIHHIYNKFTKILDNKNKLNNDENSSDKKEKKNPFLKILYRTSKEIENNKKSNELTLDSAYFDFEQIFLNESSKKKNLKIEDLIDISKSNTNNNIKAQFRKSASLVISKERKKEFNNLSEEGLKIPGYLNNPLLFNIELFMTEIELDRKNYCMSYEHIKNCLLIILILKKFGDSNNNKENSNSSKTISFYLEEIKKKCKNKILSSMVKSLQNLNLTLNQKENDKSKAINNNEKEAIKVNDPINLNKENEKLFIFLNSLSFYQIKIFNETQPNCDTRNDMPIFFSNQFKDSLTQKQRNILNKLNIMSVTRSSLLLNTNQSILPSNLKLNYSNVKKKDSPQIKKQKNIYISFDGSLLNSNIINDDKKEPEKEIYELMDDKGLKNLKKILMSSNKNNKLKSYLINNIYFVCKIIKHSNDEQIEEIIKFPEVIIISIKNYKKNHKYESNHKIVQKEIIKQLKENPRFKNILNNKRSLSKKKIADKKSEEKVLHPNHSMNNSYDFNFSSLGEEQILSEM